MLAHFFHWSPETIAGLTEGQQAGFLTGMDWLAEEARRAAKR
jgi:hypothetical protein